MSSNHARYSGGPSPYRATLRGGAGDQISVEQPCEAEQATKSLPRNLARRSRRPSPCRETLPEISVREGRPNDTSPRQRDKVGHHQTMSGPRVQRRNVSEDVRRHLTTYCVRQTTTGE
jgi:hypothetical protein